METMNNSILLRFKLQHRKPEVAENQLLKSCERQLIKPVAQGLRVLLFQFPLRDPAVILKALLSCGHLVFI